MTALVVVLTRFAVGRLLGEQSARLGGFAGVGLLGLAIFRAVTKGSRRRDVIVWSLVGLVGITISLGHLRDGG